MEAPQSAMALAAAGEEEEQRGWVQSEPVAGGAWRRWRRVAAANACLLLLGPWSSSIRVLSGRPSVRSSSCTLSTYASKSKVLSEPSPWIGAAMPRHSSDGCSTLSAGAAGGDGGWWGGPRLWAIESGSCGGGRAGTGGGGGGGGVPGSTLAVNGKAISPTLRTATVLGPRGVSITPLNGRRRPFSL